MCEKVYEISYGDVRMTGTCKFSNIDAMNRPVILDGIQLLKNQPREAWLITRTYSNTKEYDKFRSDDPCAPLKYLNHEHFGNLSPVETISVSVELTVFTPNFFDTFMA